MHFVCYLTQSNISIFYKTFFFCFSDVPDAPDAPKVTNITESTMTVKWRAPSDGGARITNYILEKQDRFSTRWTKVTQDEILITEFTVTGLTKGTEYLYRVSAENKAGVGKPSPPSEAHIAKPQFGKFVMADFLLVVSCM